MPRDVRTMYFSGQPPMRVSRDLRRLVRFEMNDLLRDSAFGATFTSDQDVIVEYETSYGTATADEDYRPGDEWIEVWKGAPPAGLLLFVGTPTRRSSPSETPAEPPVFAHTFRSGPFFAVCPEVAGALLRTGLRRGMRGPYRPDRTISTRA